MRHGIGYCGNAGCEDGERMILPTEAEIFICESCGQPGKVEMERGFSTGETGIIREVRVKYSFDPRGGRYRRTAVVRDESLPSGLDVYTRCSPLTEDKKSALSLAEALFVELNRWYGPPKKSDLPRAASFVLSFDDDIAIFRQGLRHLRERWEDAALLALRRRQQRGRHRGGMLVR
jgi:hypothetical protein